jgi:transcriptional regulator with XRE-family HTH domain
MSSPENDVSERQSRVIAATICEALARRRMSRLALADQAKISISTLEKALSGRRPFTLATTIRLEEALGMRLRKATNAEPATKLDAKGLAPDELGSYSRAAVDWIEGSYLTLRPSFGEPGAVFAYRTDIAWDEASSRLVFHEAERLDASFTQKGYVAVPHESGHVYLVTNRHGQHRLAVLSRPTITGEMYGILTTLQVGRGAQLTPVAAPIALSPLTQAKSSMMRFGRVSAHEPDYADYLGILDRAIGDSFAVLLDGR